MGQKERQAVWGEKEEELRQAIDKFLKSSNHKAAILLLYDDKFNSDIISYGEPGTLFQKLVDTFCNEVVPAGEQMFYERISKGGGQS